MRAPTNELRADVLVVGAGPAGSVAALVLARAGARVVLADRARFARDKACGDLVGPRGLRVLADLGLGDPPGPHLDDMLVVGPTGRKVRLPSFAGSSYPRRAVAVPRTVLDTWLREAALEAGAIGLTGRAGEPVASAVDGAPGIGGFVVGDTRVRAEVVIGADGATSHVASAAGLIDPARVLWAFAVRSYLPAAQAPGLRLPTILWWEPERGRPLPGYGWIFPGADGRVNLGLGVGTLADRRRASEVMRRWPAFCEHLCRTGVIESADALGAGAAPLGGWLKLGLVGTVPARDNVLLAGDAAGLVNPLQGEGIARALSSGRAAAQAVLAGPSGAAARYRSELAAHHRRFEPMAVGAHRALVGRQRVAAVLLRLLSAPVVGRTVAGGWSLLWNDLLEGAPPGPATSLARGALAIGLASARRSDATRHLAALEEGAGAAQLARASVERSRSVSRL